MSLRVLAALLVGATVMLVPAAQLAITRWCDRVRDSGSTVTRG